MVTGLLIFFGGMFSAVLINYALHEPNKQIEDYEYRNSGHDGPKDKSQD